MEEMDSPASDGPHASRVGLNEEIGEGLPHPIEEGHTAIGMAREDTTQGQKLGREEAVAVSGLANGICAAEPGLSGDAINASRVSEERWVGVGAQEGGEHKGRCARRPNTISSTDCDFHLGQMHRMNGSEFRAVKSGREQALPYDRSVGDGAESEFALGGSFAESIIALDASTKMPA
jgi:hypothetical protein